MTETAMADALRRIDAALSRLETGAQQALARHADLSGQHEALRDTVGETLGELDDLIALAEKSGGKAP